MKFFFLFFFSVQKKIEESAFDVYLKTFKGTAGKPHIPCGLNQASERVAKRRPWRNGPNLITEPAKGKKLERTVGKADPKKSSLISIRSISKGLVTWLKVVKVVSKKSWLIFVRKEVKAD